MNLLITIRLGLIASLFAGALASVLNPSEAMTLVEHSMASLDELAQAGSAALARLLDPTFWQQLAGCPPGGSNSAELPWT